MANSEAGVRTRILMFSHPANCCSAYSREGRAYVRTSSFSQFSGSCSSADFHRGNTKSGGRTDRVEISGEAPSPREGANQCNASKDSNFGPMNALLCEFSRQTLQCCMNIVFPERQLPAVRTLRIHREGQRRRATESVPLWIASCPGTQAVEFCFAGVHSMPPDFKPISSIMRFTKILAGPSSFRVPVAQR